MINYIDHLLEVGIKVDNNVLFILKKMNCDVYYSDEVDVDMIGGDGSAFAIYKGKSEYNLKNFSESFLITNKYAKHHTVFISDSITNNILGFILFKDLNSFIYVDHLASVSSSEIKTSKYNISYIGSLLLYFCSLESYKNRRFILLTPMIDSINFYEKIGFKSVTINHFAVMITKKINSVYETIPNPKYFLQKISQFIYIESDEPYIENINVNFKSDVIKNFSMFCHRLIKFKALQGLPLSKTLKAFDQHIYSSKKIAFEKMRYQRSYFEEKQKEECKNIEKTSFISDAESYLIDNIKALITEATNEYLEWRGNGRGIYHYTAKGRIRAENFNREIMLKEVSNHTDLLKHIYTTIGNYPSRNHSYSSFIRRKLLGFEKISKLTGSVAN